MDQVTPTTSGSDGSPVTELPAYLHELDPKQWKRISTPVMDTVTRHWDDGSVDTLLVLSPALAYGQRDNHRGRPVQRECGPAVETARLLQHLPPPATPDAPIDELPDTPLPEREM